VNRLSAGALLFASLTVGPAIAADPTMSTHAGGTFFASITGAWILGAGPDDWQLFGPNVEGPSGTPFTTAGPGGMGRAEFGYRWDSWDLSVGAQHIELGAGAKPPASFFGEELSATSNAFDAALGWNTLHGDSMWRTSFGVRYAEWHNLVKPFGSGDPIRVFHNFGGVGPRAEISAKMPVSGNMSVVGSAAVAALFGTIATSSTAGWFCTDCNNYGSTALNADGSIGIGWSLAPGVDLVVGYQAQLWQGVNVRITDDTGLGGNRGTSGYLTHGPFASLKVEFGHP
jgi:hypothetical protein